jgi:hypothetical protein
LMNDLTIPETRWPGVYTAAHLVSDF